MSTMSFDEIKIPHKVVDVHWVSLGIMVYTDSNMCTGMKLPEDTLPRTHTIIK